MAEPKRKPRGKAGLDEVLVHCLGDRIGMTNVLFLQCIPSSNFTPEGRLEIPY